MLSLLATGVPAPDDPRYVALPGVDRPVLRVAAIYGPNGAGKSNLLSAMMFAVKKASTVFRSTESVPRTPFAFDPAARGAPSVFEFVLHLDGRVWYYGFALDDERVLEEWLSVDAPDHDVWHRETLDDGSVAVTFADDVGSAEDRAGFYAFLARGTAKDRLFMAELGDKNAASTAALTGPVGGWLDGVHMSADVASGSRIAEAKYLHATETIPGINEHLTGFLSGEGTAITEVYFEPGNQPAAERVRFVEQFGDARAVFSLNQISTGTRRLVQLGFPMALSAAYTFVVDELDRALHPLLSRAVVRQAAAQGQLIFTTHDTDLLDIDLLPDDGVWFVDRGADGASKLYALSEFKPEQVQALRGQLEQGYFDGRFGAIPVFPKPPAVP